MIAMRHRNTRICGDGNRTRNTGYNFKGNARFGQSSCFFASAAEHKRVTTFKAANIFAEAGLFDHEPVNVFLLQVFITGFLPDVDDFGIRSGFFKKVQVVSVLSGEPEYMDPLGADTPVGWWVTGFPADDNRPTLKKFRDDYSARYKTYPRFGSLIGYVTIKTIAAGIERAGSTETPKLIKGLEGAKFDSPIGSLTMRAGDHQLTLGSWVGQLGLKDGKPVMTNWTFIDGKDALPSEAVGRSRRPPGAND